MVNTSNIGNKTKQLVEAHWKDIAVVGGIGALSAILAYNAESIESLSESLPIAGDLIRYGGNILGDVSFLDFIFEKQSPAEILKDWAPSIGAAASYLTAHCRVQENNLRHAMGGLSAFVIATDFGLWAADQTCNWRDYLMFSRACVQGSGIGYSAYRLAKFFG